MAIVKKTYIDNSIFKELAEKYPLQEAGNGVKYKQKLDYITFETDFLQEPVLRVLKNQYGFEVIAVIFYLRTEMCKNGWKVRVDKGIYYDVLVDDCSHCCNINQQLTDEIIQKLIEMKLMYEVCDTEVEEGVWLTCPQQIYNYEMACNNRQQSRKRQANHRAREKEKKIQNEETVQPETSNDNFQIMQMSQGDVNNNPFGDNLFEDNPFGV